MQNIEIFRQPRNLFERFRPLPEPGAGLLPAMAYGGLQTQPARALRSSQSLGRFGSLEVRLAHTAAEVRQAQKLRFRVFYQEGTALTDPARMLARRDIDAFDAICDHLLVLDHDRLRGPSRKPMVVGTYRLLRQSLANKYGGFYTAGEFDIAGLIERHRHLNFLELGRSCVLTPYRTKRTVELLWQGIWAYVKQNNIDVMLGCASFEGTNPAALALPLSFLHHYAPAPDLWQAKALPELYVGMNRMAKDEIDPKAALRCLPPLIKGYLRLGAHIGEGAVIDREFGTTDVLVILPVSAIDARYIEHFGPESRAA